MRFTLVTAILVALTIVVALPSAKAGEKVDQSQTAIDYGFFFHAQVKRWQEFTAGSDHLTRLDVYVTKVGSPGNIYIQLLDPQLRLIASTKLLEEDVATGWVTVEYTEVLPLAIGHKYRISMFSDRGPEPDLDYYAWRGSNLNNYNSDAMNDVINSWPNYDYAFVTYSPTPDNLKCYEARGDNLRRFVRLVDQFREEPSSLVLSPSLFCNPVNMNGEGISNPESHLTCYKIKEPKDVKRIVDVENEFGVQTLKLKKPKLLCVPTSKPSVVEE